MDTAEHPTTTSTASLEAGEFEALATALLAASDLDETVALARRAFVALLEPDYRCRIELADGRGMALDHPPSIDDVACIPLRWEGALLGAALISGADGAPTTAARLAAPALGSVARLTGAALAARTRVVAQHASLVKEASELKFDVVSMLSHEMRTPLASIKGYVSALLLDDVEWDSAVRVEFLQTIEAETDHLTTLVTEMLESAAIDAGELRIEVEPTSIPAIARHVVGKLRIRTDIHRFAVSFPPGFPAVSADAERIEQVLTNLVDNAIKYSPDGGLVVVRGELRPTEVIVSVVDQGIGIAPEDLNKLFERFFRASPNRRRRIGGTGLGLPIADAIIRAHGGRIWAESAIGSGTTLSFALPRTGTEAAA